MGFITASEARAMALTREQLNEARVQSYLDYFDKQVRTVIEKEQKTSLRLGASLTEEQHQLLQKKLREAGYVVKEVDGDDEGYQVVYLVSW
jgi:Spy/CpxP family protein refolding chaperone